MNRSEFLNFIIKQKSFSKEIYKYSLDIKDFPIARQILNKLDGNIYTNILLKSDNIVEIRSAQAELIATVVNFIKDSLVKSETKKFIDDLVDQRIIQGYLEKKEASKLKKLDNKNKKSISNNLFIPTKGINLTAEEIYTLILKKEGLKKNKVSELKSTILNDQISIKDKEGTNIVTYWKDPKTKLWTKKRFDKSLTKDGKKYIDKQKAQDISTKKEIHTEEMDKSLHNIIKIPAYLFCVAVGIICIVQGVRQVSCSEYSKIYDTDSFCYRNKDQRLYFLGAFICFGAAGQVYDAFKD